MSIEAVTRWIEARMFVVVVLTSLPFLRCGS